MKTSLLLFSNRLSSSLVTEIGRLTALTTEFEAYDNSLSGSLPSELGALRSMEVWFRLDSNLFTAEVREFFYSSRILRLCESCPFAAALY